MKNRIIFSIVLTAFISFITGCATVPVTSFPGEPKDPKDIAALVFNDNMWPTLSVYKVDGKTSTALNTTHSYLLAGKMQEPVLNLQLLPGKHDLEVCLPKTKEVKLVSYDFKAGGNYQFIVDEKSFSMVQIIDGKQVPVNFQVKDIPEYKEPGEKEPHALLFDQSISKKEGDTLFSIPDGGYVNYHRIDGLHGNSWWQFSVTMNLSDKGSIRVKPGVHTIEYSGAFGKERFMHHIGTITHNFEAGKKYRIYLDDIDSNGQAAARVIEVK